MQDGNIAARISRQRQSASLGKLLPVVVGLLLWATGSLTGAEKAGPKTKGTQPGPGLTANPTNAPLRTPPKRPKGLAPGEDFFRTNFVRRIRLEMSPESMQSLRRDGRKYVRANLIENGVIYRDVAIHLKGAAGSSRGLDDKPAMTVNFDKYTPDQNFYGLSKVHLNNSVQDPSYLAEYLCGELFRDAGVPATRVAHAVVELNDRKLGFYVIKEGFTKEFLSLHYKNVNGNLYDGGFLRDITEPLERDSGSGPSDHADLKALAAAAQERDLDQRWERLNQVLDVPRFISFMVMENITWDWDGYPMNRNNYRIFQDLDSGRMVFFPHGTDQMFSQPEGPILSPLQGLMAQSIMRMGEGRRLYRQRYYELFRNGYDAADLTNHLGQLERSLLAGLTNEYPDIARDFSHQARDLRERMMARAKSIERQLKETPASALKFTSGQAELRNWRRQEDNNSAQMENAPSADGNNSLSIKAPSATTASWRMRVTLPQGKYAFEGRVKCAGVKPARADAASGAGLRVTLDEPVRASFASGDADWKILACPLEIKAPFEELELMCELRNASGQAWFELESLRVVRRE